MVRAMDSDDWAAVRRIYREGIATGHATFDRTVPDRRILDHSWLPERRWVAEIDGRWNRPVGTRRWEWAGGNGPVGTRRWKPGGGNRPVRTGGGNRPVRTGGGNRPEGTRVGTGRATATTPRPDRPWPVIGVRPSGRLSERSGDQRPESSSPGRRLLSAIDERPRRELPTRS
jgi:hypothetical protein